jgi:hypothetical protein
MVPYTFNGSMGCAKVATTGKAGSRWLNSNIPTTSDGVYYFSWIMKPTVNVWASVEWGYMGSSNFYPRITTTWGSNHLTFSLKNGSEVLGTCDTAAGSCPLNVKKLIVVKLIATGGSSNDQAFLKIYDESDTFDIDDSQVDWDAAVSGMSDNVIDAINLGAGTNPGLYLDEFRAGTEWADVVPGREGLADGQPLPGRPHDPNLLIYEDFYYNGIKLDNGNGGFGWGGPWCARKDSSLSADANIGTFLTGSSQADITSEKILDRADLPFAPRGGAAFEYVDNDPCGGEDLAYRYIEDGVQLDFDVNTAYYISFLLRRDDGGTTTSNEYFNLNLYELGRYNTYQVAGFGVTSSEGYQISIYDDALGSCVTASSGSSAFQVKTTYFVVLKIAAMSDDDSANYDQISLKVYSPTDTIDTTEPVSWTLQTPDTVNCTSYDGEVLCFYSGRTAVTAFDELRIGKTWESVVGSLPVCGLPAGDFTGDCEVDFSDFAVFANDWLTN